MCDAKTNGKEPSTERRSHNEASCSRLFLLPRVSLTPILRLYIPKTESFDFHGQRFTSALSFLLAASFDHLPRGFYISILKGVKTYV